MAIALKPMTYECPEHHVDLTNNVLKKLEEDIEVPTSGWGAGVTFGYRIPQPKITDHPFLVVISCPGHAPKKEAHDVECEGKYSEV